MFAMFVITPNIPIPKTKIHLLPLLESCEGSFSSREPGLLFTSKDTL